jgi:hypothetical protein
MTKRGHRKVSPYALLTVRSLNMGYDTSEVFGILRGLLEEPPNARCDVGLVANAAEKPATIPAGSEEEILRIRGAGIVLGPALVEAVVRRENDQGLTLYAPGP